MQLAVQKYFLKHINEIGDKFFLIINRILFSKEEAEDAIQEVILKLRLWQMDPEKGDGFRGLEVHSVTMVKNYYLDRLKSKQAQTFFLDERFEGVNSDLVQKKIEQVDKLNFVQELIDRLPEKERLIIQLLEIEQYDFNEITSILNSPEGTIRVYLLRIRKKLRKQFIEI